jgi:hypothetical protein
VRYRDLPLLMLLVACGGATAPPTEVPATPTMLPATPTPVPRIPHCGTAEAHLAWCTAEPAAGSVACPTPQIRFGISGGSFATPGRGHPGWGIGPVMLDGVDITWQGRSQSTSEAPPSSTWWTYRPATPLTPGRHEVTAAYGDMAGIARTFRWAFEVQPIACPG